MARINMGGQLVIPLALAVAALLHVTAADEIVVGGDLGWTVPTTNTTFYSAWASSNTFEVNDTLVFNFATGTHDVAIVTKEAYDACSTGNTISTIQNGPANVRLNTTGAHYFICTFPGHCAGGQKLAINVVADSDSDNSSPAPSGTTAPPPPSDSASSRGVTLFPILLFIAVALFC